jgi:Skp family chaperone for outer membrane proteins
MHIAQAEEFSLLRDLFIEDPEALLCAAPNQPGWQWEHDDLVLALKDCNLTPQADPNTPSHTIRVMKAVALVQLVQLNPAMWDLHAVVRRVAQMVGMGNIDELFAPPQGQMDGKQAESMQKAMAKMQELAQKEQDSKRKADLEIVMGHIKMISENAKLQAMDRQNMSRERIEGAKIAQKRMELAESSMVHPLATPIAQQFMQGWPMPGQGSPNGGGRII